MNGAQVSLLSCRLIAALDWLGLLLAIVWLLIAQAANGAVLSSACNLACNCAPSSDPSPAAGSSISRAIHGAAIGSRGGLQNRWTP